MQVKTIRSQIYICKCGASHGRRGNQAYHRRVCENATAAIAIVTASAFGNCRETITDLVLKHAWVRYIGLEFRSFRGH